MRHLLLLVASLTLAGHLQAASGETNLFRTQFEKAEGYNTAYDLVGQNGWLGDGTGGNGLVDGFFAGYGQQAYVGYAPPTNTDESELYVWRPIGFAPRTNAPLPVLKFSVLMSIVDSSTNNAHYDNFRWIFFNHQTNRLFTIDFDNYYWSVSYALDGTNSFTGTSVRFTNSVYYLLQVTMNLASNRWSATLDDALIATNLPITTVGALLSLGEVDACWAIYDAAKPGDNFMLFDNYTITLFPPPPRPPHLQLLSRTGTQTTLRVRGPNGSRYAVDASTNLVSWTALKTNVTGTNGFYDYLDNSTAKTRFYRGRFVP